MNRQDVDLHVHTTTSVCGYITHQRLLDMARASGHGVLAVSDHDTAAGALAVRTLAARSGDDVLVAVGMELTTTDLGHVVIFGRGVEEDWGWEPHRPFPRHIPDHWVAIQAHPYRRKVAKRSGRVEVEELPPLPERIDAVEVWNGVDMTFYSPHLRAELAAVSCEYVRRYRKIAVASSDAHRPLVVHSCFTRFDRPLRSVDDLVDQIRSGQVTPHVESSARVDWCTEAWRRRNVVGWHEAGKDWRELARAAGYELDAAATWLADFKRVQSLATRGATLAQICGATGLALEMVADYLDMVNEEQYATRKRVGQVAG